jgi:hypothetical protein
MSIFLIVRDIKCAFGENMFWSVEFINFINFCYQVSLNPWQVVSFHSIVLRECQEFTLDRKQFHILLCLQGCRVIINMQRLRTLKPSEPAEFTTEFDGGIGCAES